MRNLQNQLSESLNKVVILLEEFDKTKDDYKKPLIRAELANISHIAKVIGGVALIKTKVLIEDINNFLDGQNISFTQIITDALNLKNNLWQL